MVTVCETITLDHSLHQVWSLFTDPDRWLQWNTELAAIRDVRGPFDHPGAGYTQVWKFAGIEKTGQWAVTSCMPAQEREVAGVTPIGLAFRARETFRANDDGGSEVTVEISWDTPGGPLGRAFDRLLAAPMLHRALRKNAKRIDEVLRSTSP